MSSPYRQFQVPVNLNILCADYLSALNIIEMSYPRSQATEARHTITLLRQVLDIALGFGFQDRVGGSVHTLSMQLDAVDVRPLNTPITKEWFEDAADKAIDAYFERAVESVQSLTQSIRELTANVKQQSHP